MFSQCVEGRSVSGSGANSLVCAMLLWLLALTILGGVDRLDTMTTCRVSGS